MYAMAFEDLNGDKKVEALVFLTGSHWCGSGGCTLLVLAEKQEQWTVQSKIPTSRLPLYALESKSNGWQDISVLVVGGGRMKAGHAVVTFEKQKAKYVKSKKVIDIEPVNEKIVLSRKPAYQTL